MYGLFTVREPVGGFGPVTTVLILLYAMSRGRGILASMRMAGGRSLGTATMHG